MYESDDRRLVGDPDPHSTVFAFIFLLVLGVALHFIKREPMQEPKTNESANGTEGMLIYTGETYMFRHYHKDGFTDYDIHHSDLNIVIKDADAHFYTDAKGRNRLDHSPSTLGVDATP